LLRNLSLPLEKDITDKTGEGYYHALYGVPVAEYAETLQDGEPFSLDAGKSIRTTSAG
jgi:hypothetical protein